MKFARFTSPYSTENALDGILSVFYRPSIPGRIYIEARTEATVRKAVGRVSPLTPSYTLEQISNTDILRFFRMQPPWIDAEKYPWLRITRGTYKNDIAMMIEEEALLDGTVNANVRVIPRLPPSRTTLGKRERTDVKGKERGKKRQRAKQRLFDPTEWPKSNTRGTTIVSNSKVFIDGLLDMHVLLTDVTPLDTVSVDEYLSFRDIQTIHPTRAEFFEERMACLRSILVQSTLEPGDRVIVDQEPSESNVGTIVEFFPNDRNTATLRGLVSGVLVQTERRLLRKVFRIGDAVRVIGGKEDGREAWVVGVGPEKIRCAYMIKYDHLKIMMALHDTPTDPSIPTDLDPIKEVCSNCPVSVDVNPQIDMNRSRWMTGH